MPIGVFPLSYLPTSDDGYTPYRVTNSCHDNQWLASRSVLLLLSVGRLFCREVSLVFELLLDMANTVSPVAS